MATALPFYCEKSISGLNDMVDKFISHVRNLFKENSSKTAMEIYKNDYLSFKILLWYYSTSNSCFFAADERIIPVIGQGSASWFFGEKLLPKPPKPKLPPPPNVEFTQNEFNSILQDLGNTINGDPIEFYLILKYKHSRLLNSSTYSIGASNEQFEEFSFTPHYDSKHKLKFYAASRFPHHNGIEYIVRADALHLFIDNYELYKAAANAFYLRGTPTQAELKYVSGDIVSGLSDMWKDALSDPQYCTYLANVMLGATIGKHPSKPMRAVGNKFVLNLPLRKELQTLVLQF